MKRKWAPVTDRYFGNPVGNGQDPDEPAEARGQTDDGNKIHGSGAKGGGSKPSPRGRRSGSAALGSTRPRSPQKLRG